MVAKEFTDASNAQAIGDRCGSPAPGGHSILLGSVTTRNTVFLAPLSGISDVPFRRIARRFGAGLVISEMVASGEFVRGDPASALRAMRDGEGPHVVQLAGRDPRSMRAAAERLAGLGADVIDINMGCPAKKVVGGLSGSALMREPALALEIVAATVAGAGSVPVTLKMRLGWDRASINAAWLAERAVAAGVQMITVHGRTREQFYEGRADWHAISAVKAAVDVPVVANGDLVEPGEERRMLAVSRADAVMIGRGACGRPWLPGLIAGDLAAAELDRMIFHDLVLGHYEAMLEHYGARAGVRHARKHLGWYLGRFSAASGATLASERSRIMTADNPDLVATMLKNVFGRVTIGALEQASADRREAA